MSLLKFAIQITKIPLIWNPYAAFSRVTSARLSSSKVNAEDVNAKLMEFFDTKKNWGENEVKHGRGWTLSELRIKSNEDLHKLWFVLLKEKNMLLTMENDAIEEHRLLPSPERVDKVEESMTNLESVVRERNRAYHELETGENGERPGKPVFNQLGLKYFYRSSEHVIPIMHNKKWRESHVHQYGGVAVAKFLKLYREKLWNVKRRQKNRDRNQVVGLLRRNPDLDRQLLKKKYPNVHVDILEKKDAIRGHYVPKL